ncbi:MAG: FmdB family zinc ribbon protein [Solirubrobacterales bacterium]
MPIYEYRCENGHQFEVFRNMSDDPLTSCEECGAPVQRVFNPVAVHFKGSGFYTTDYAKSDGKSAASDGKSADKKDSSKDKKNSEGKSKDSGSDSKGSGDKTKTS